MKIYVARNGQRFGPYPVEVLESFLAAGKVTSTDWAWAPGHQAWVPLKVVLAGIQKQSSSPHEAVEQREAGSGLSPDIPQSREETTDEVELSTESQGGLRTAQGPVGKPNEGIPVLEPVEAQALEVPTVPQLGDEKPPAATPQPSRRARGKGAAHLKKFIGATAAGILLVGTLLVVTKVPSHASFAVTDHGFLRPDEGYEFVDSNDFWNWDVQWVPGKPNSTQAHMLAGPEADTWRPAPGYERSASQELVWVPQKREPEYPHVVAGSEPGTWIPDPGYVLTGSASPTSPEVVWRQGERLPHMESAKQENYWTLDPGYAFALLESTAEHPKASWSPGKRHYSYPHIYAAPTEGVWFTDPGYQWLSPGTWDLRTFSPAQTWQAWQLAADIDASTHGIDCTSDGAVLSVIEAARDRFGALDTKDVHPLLAQHFANVQSALDRGATTINTCFVVNHAKDGADLGAAALCLFSSKTWQECMDDSATARKVIGVVGELGSVPCDQALKDFGQKLDELGSERQRLQDDFRARYDLQLTRPIRLVTCR